MRWQATTIEDSNGVAVKGNDYFTNDVSLESCHIKINSLTNTGVGDNLTKTKNENDFHINRFSSRLYIKIN